MPSSNELVSRGFVPVITGQRYSDEIVTQIKDALRHGTFKPGDRLPAERALCEQFGVSRNTVRDALRVLETSGLVEIRTGARGGAFVRTPDPATLVDGIIHLLMASSLTPAEVTEARIVIEVGTARLACERATEDDVAALEAICARAEAHAARGGYFPDLSAQFHSRLAECSHNGALQMVVESLHSAVVASIAEARVATTEAERRARERFERTQLDDHRAMVEAVKTHDADLAERLMREHLTRTAERLRPSAGARTKV